MLSRNQKNALAGFLGNYAITWLAAGIIAPVVTNSYSEKTGKVFLISTIWVVVSLMWMLLLTGGDD